MVKGDGSDDRNGVYAFFVVGVRSQYLRRAIKNGWNRLVKLFCELAPWDAVGIL